MRARLKRLDVARRAMQVLAVGALISLPGAGPGGASVSGPAANVEGNAISGSPQISANGRFVAFDSAASNLVLGDTNAQSDVFVRDLVAGTTQRASVSSTGVQANGLSGLGRLSGDGHLVAFQSSASNLVPGDTNGVTDVFLHNLVTGTTRRVSLSATGGQGNGNSGYASLSADGNLVTFSSDASNLVAGDRNGVADVFVHNVATGATQRINVSTAGAQAKNGTAAYAPISADGRFVAFSSASPLVAGDTNGRADVFVRNLATGTTARVSVSSTGAQVYRPSYAMGISADGRVVVFFSSAAKLVRHDTNHQTDVFVRNRGTSKTRLVSVSTSGAEANLGATVAAISGDGRVVVFESPAKNLVGGDTNRVSDIFVHNRMLHRTWRVSVSSSEGQANGASYLPAISADGKMVAFGSFASNLVAGDTNGVADVFVRDRTTGTTQRVSVS